MELSDHLPRDPLYSSNSQIVQIFDIPKSSLLVRWDPEQPGKTKVEITYLFARNKHSSVQIRAVSQTAMEGDNA